MSIDALLNAVVDVIRGANLGYGQRECAVQEDGHPPPRCGNWYVAVHQGPVESLSSENLDERYGWNVTLTMRLTIPKDRIGDYSLAKKSIDEAGFNRRMAQLRALLHYNATLVGRANEYLVQMNPDADEIYGFSELPEYRSWSTPQMVGGEWFGAEPDALDVGVTASLTFEGPRRLQAAGSFV